MAASKANNDIHAGQGSALKWNCDDACASLDAVLRYVEQEADKAIDWYWRNKQWKALFSRGIQFSAVSLAALAGLLPILAQIGRGPNDTGNVNAGLWASVLVGTVAALLGMDKAFGFSSGWTRYVLTATAIRKALEEFRLDWALLAADACPCPNPPPDKVAIMLHRAKEFSTTVEGLVLQETREWATEFQSNISQLEKDAKTQIDALRAQVDKERQALAVSGVPGAIELTVADAANTDGATFHVRLENAERVSKEADVVHATKWVEINIPPGQYKLTATAKKDGAPVADAAVVQIKSNETLKVTLTLA